MADHASAVASPPPTSTPVKTRRRDHRPTRGYRGCARCGRRMRVGDAKARKSLFQRLSPKKTCAGPRIRCTVRGCGSSFFPLPIQSTGRSFQISNAFVVRGLIVKYGLRPEFFQNRRLPIQILGFVNRGDERKRKLWLFREASLESTLRLTAFSPERIRFGRSRWRAIRFDRGFTGKRNAHWLFQELSIGARFGNAFKPR